MGNSLLLSDAFQALSTGARMLYFAMAMESGGRRQFTFPAQCFKKYGIPARSARRYILELTEAQFIVCACSGRNTRTPSDYEFCFGWKSNSAVPKWHSQPP